MSDTGDKTCPCGLSKRIKFDGCLFERWAVVVKTEGGLSNEFLQVNYCPECGKKLKDVDHPDRDINISEYKDSFRDHCGNMHTLQVVEETIDNDVYIVKTLNCGGGEYPDFFRTYTLTGYLLFDFVKHSREFQVPVISVEKLEDK